MLELPDLALELGHFAVSIGEQLGELLKGRLAMGSYIKDRSLFAPQISIE